MKMLTSDQIVTTLLFERSIRGLSEFPRANPGEVWERRDGALFDCVEVTQTADGIELYRMKTPEGAICLWDRNTLRGRKRVS